MSFSYISSFTNYLYTYYTPLESFCLTLEYNINLNFLTISNYMESVELTEYTAQAYTDVLTVSLYKDFAGTLGLLDNIGVSPWFNNFLNYLDKITPLTYQASFLNNAFIDLARSKENNFFLANGNWILKDGSLLEMPILISQKLLEAFCLLYLLLVIYILTSAAYSTFRKDSTDNDHLICTGSTQSEKEIGNFDDLINTALILIFLFSCYTNQLICSSILNYLIRPELFFTGFLLFFATLFLNLILILWDLGVLSLIFIRGSSKKQSFLYETALDILFLFTYFLRTLVQNIRVMLIFTFYLSYVHALEDSYPEIYDDTISLSGTLQEILNPTTYNYQLVKTFAIIGMHWVYETLHFILATASQLVAFFLIIFWVFNSLYFTYENNTSEHYLMLKRREFRGGI